MFVFQMGEKSRDDALEAIKGNLDGFSRDAKLHPTPTSHPKNAGILLWRKLLKSSIIMWFNSDKNTWRCI